MVEGFLTGLHRSPRRGFSVEFAEHRMYQPGDELRYVDWKILGRNDRLYVKQFEEETNLRAMVVCDVSRSMAWSGAPETVLAKLAYAQRLIAALSLILLRQRDATGLITFDDEVRAVLPPRARPSHWHQLLDALEGLEAGNGTAAEPALRRVVDQLRRRGLVVFVSDLLLDRDLALKALRFLRHRGHQVLVLHLMDPAEVALGGPAEARFEDPETRAAVVLRPRDWAGAYRRTVRSVVAEWRLACRRHGIGYHRVTTDTPYGVVLRQALSPASAGGMIGFLHPWALAGLAARPSRSFSICSRAGSRRRWCFPRCATSWTLPGSISGASSSRICCSSLVRTLLIIALVLAAAGPTVARRRAGESCAERARAGGGQFAKQRGRRGGHQPAGEHPGGRRGRCSSGRRRTMRSGCSRPTACPGGDAVGCSGAGRRTSGLPLPPGSGRGAHHGLRSARRPIPAG